MFARKKKNFLLDKGVIGRIEAADGRILASAGELVALCHERAAVDAATVVAAYAATIPTPPAPAGPAAGLEACRQHLAAMQEFLDTL